MELVTNAVTLTGTCLNPSCGASLSTTVNVTSVAGQSGSVGDHVSCGCGTTSPVSG